MSRALFTTNSDVWVGVTSSWNGETLTITYSEITLVVKLGEGGCSLTQWLDNVQLHREDFATTDQAIMWAETFLMGYKAAEEPIDG